MAAARVTRRGLPYPSAIAREYERRLLARVEDVHRRTMAAVEEVLPTIRFDAEGLRADSPEDEARRIVAAITRMRGLLAATLVVDVGPIGKTAAAVDAFATPHANRLISVAVERAGREAVPRIGLSTIAPRSMFAEWVAENVALIKSIDARYFTDVEVVTLQAFADGLGPEGLRRLYRERFAVSRARATLIARDQVGKLNGQINRRRQTDAGVDSYTWSDSNDERVRPVHKERDGKVFRWDQHPSTVDGHPDGHPGEPVQCRCSAIPVI